MEASRGSGAAPASEDVRTDGQDAVAEQVPALLDDLRTRMEAVRARLGGLAESAQRAEDSPAGMVTVPADLLARLHHEIAATRGLLAAAAAQLGEGGDADEPHEGSAERDTACVVALNMALNGAPRAEAERYLDENFDLPDAQLIVAEAYAQRARMRPNGGATR